MGNRLSRICTRTDDDGTTGLGDGARVEACGTDDEANSAIGIVLAVPGLPADIARCLVEIQHDLFDLGGEASRSSRSTTSGSSRWSRCVTSPA